jgi:hypothetical protein
MILKSTTRYERYSDLQDWTIFLERPMGLCAACGGNAIKQQRSIYYFLELKCSKAFLSVSLQRQKRLFRRALYVKITNDRFLTLSC